MARAGGAAQRVRGAGDLFQLAADAEQRRRQAQLVVERAEPLQRQHRHRPQGLLVERARVEPVDGRVAAEAVEIDRDAEEGHG